MAITAADVKKLRDMTGAGMMDAKKALDEANGDFDGAIEILRVAGQAKTAKRADRDAKNGLVAGAGKTVIRLAAETDFVAKNDEFVSLASEIVKAVAAAGIADLDTAQAVTLASGQTPRPSTLGRQIGGLGSPSRDLRGRRPTCTAAARTCPRRSA